MKNKRWHMREIGQVNGLPYPLSQILFGRGIRTPEAARGFLEVHQNKSEASLLNTDAACDVIHYHLDKQKSIIVYGDYDVDGITAAAVLVEALEQLGGNVNVYIPNRFDEGYGLHPKIMHYFAMLKKSLIITVDCGIRSLEEAELARQLGIDLVVVDHHEPGPELPNASAIINPKQHRDTYPFKDFAGVGLAYKLATNFFLRDTSRFLDLVALGTVADMVPLIDENRNLVYRGLYRLCASKRPGIRALAKAARIDQGDITATAIAFMLGPRLNAAGRLDTAQDAYQLLTTRDTSEAARLARQLDQMNHKRQKLTALMTDHADQLVAARDTIPLVLFAAQAQYNPGVVGLVASRLCNLYYRPTIIGHQEADVTRASCRSIPEFHITRALEQCDDLLEAYGGHAAAAGLTIRNDKRAAFIERMNDIARDELQDIELSPQLKIDAEIELPDITLELLEQLSWLEPTGMGNPRPLFVTRNLEIADARSVGKTHNHLKLTLADGLLELDAIAFNQSYWLLDLPQRVDVIHTPSYNSYSGGLQLEVADMKTTQKT